MPPQEPSPNRPPEPTTRLEPPIIRPSPPADMPTGRSEVPLEPTTQIKPPIMPPPPPRETPPPSPQPATRIQPVVIPPEPPSSSPPARASKGPLFWALVGSVVTIVIVGAGFYLYGMFLSGNAPSSENVQAPVTAPETTEQKLSVVSDQFFSNLDTLDGLEENDPLVQQVLPSDFAFEISQYTAPIRTGDGINVVTTASPEWPEIQQELELANLTNQKTIQVRGKDVVIELLEWHAVDFGKKPECASEGRCGVEYRYKLSVNGYQVAMNGEEVRTFLFDDGSKMNMTVTGSGVDFMIKVLEN